MPRRLSRAQLNRSGLMWLSELYIQRLQRIELTEPWPAAGPGLLAGAITLVFERDAVMCSSPLRYSHC